MAARPFSLRKVLMPLGLALLLAGCAHRAIDAADRLARAGRYEEALAQLDDALQTDPSDGPLRSAHARQRDRVVALALAQADLALAAGRPEAAELLLNRVRQLAPLHPRLAPASAQLQQAQLQQQRQQQARERERARREAEAATPTPAATATANAGLTPIMSAAYQKPVSLELRDAPLRQVFEVLARASGMNFVFDKEVRGDSKVTVFLRQVTLDEALRVVMATQGLDRKLLNETTLLVYPNTQGKQREHQELVTRTLYLVNADARQALSLVRTMTKTRDLYADERLNLLVVRDTPEVVRQVEQLIATLDLPEPEVMLAVEVMEVATARVEELGLSWPTQLQYGVPNFSGQVGRAARDTFAATVANPVLLATLRGDAGSTNLLANPTIRVRQREKAKVQIGERLPVFSTTSVVNAGVSVSVNYLDVGLKLEVEPVIQLDGDVSIKLAMEVSNLLQEVSGPQGSIAYKVGTRLTSTSLRLKDGETQVLAGLINDEDRQRAVGVPGLSNAPLLGKLFGVQGDTRNKTEIVMLITPRIVRRTEPPSAQDSTLASGTDTQPGAPPLRLRPQASAGTGLGAGVAASGDGTSTPTTARTARAAAPSPSGLQLVATRQAAVGATLSVGLVNRGQQVLQGELVYDAQALVPASGGGSGSNNAGRARFDLSPGGEQVLLLRVQPAAAGQTLNLQVQGLPEGVAVEGDTEIRIEPAAGAKTSQAQPNTDPERSA